MFCPNCGEEISYSNQKFCHKCGSEIIITSKIPQLQQTAVSSDFQTNQSIKEGRPGPHSKKCLAFSIISIAIAIAMLAVSGILRLMHYFGMPYILSLIGMSIVTLIHIVGLILGILSRNHDKKAQQLESENTVEKIGSVFTIFGIIGNTILLIIGSIVVLIFIIVLFL